MMDVAIVHNAKSGDRSVSADALCEAVIAAGHNVLSYASIKERSWRERVEFGADVVVAAGGDGTVRKVFTMVAESGAVATVIALGTCNNVARTLGLPMRAPLEAVGMWGYGMVESRYHLPRVSSDGFHGLCTEGAGAGLLAELIQRADDTHADTDDPWELLRQVIVDAPAGRWAVGIDGSDASGDYLAVHATVVRQTGPNLLISPEADPTSPELGVVLIRTGQRPQLWDYVDARRRGEHPASPTFDVISARRVEISPPGAVAVSVDDAVIGQGTDVLTVEARSEFARVLVPRGRFESA